VITLPSTLITVDLQHGYRSSGPTIGDLPVAMFEVIAAYVGFGLGIVNSGVGLINLWRSSRDALRGDQRNQRQRLREILIDIHQVFDLAAFELARGIKTLGYRLPSEIRDTQESLQKLRREGILISPSDDHLETILSRNAQC
jgi:hypothetical protein